MLNKFSEAYETLIQANLALNNFLGPVLSVCAFNYILQLKKQETFVDAAN